jgi:hypothetical protein
MRISDNKRLLDVKREFSEKFPFLKIEFYRRQHEVHQGSPERHHIPAETTIGEARLVHEEGELSINGHLKVSTLEQNFFEKFGLNVQVFRKSGNLWLQTTATDDWTLAEQNERGKMETDFYVERQGLTTDDEKER